jgi:hypothetical protein
VSICAHTKEISVSVSKCGEESSVSNGSTRRGVHRGGEVGAGV